MRFKLAGGGGRVEDHDVVVGDCGAGCAEGGGNGGGGNERAAECGEEEGCENHSDCDGRKMVSDCGYVGSWWVVVSWW